MINEFKLTFGALAAFATLPLVSAQAPAAAESLPALSQDSLILSGALDNGMRYLIRPTREPAGRGSVRLFVDVGSLHETDENSGISHFLEHMVFNGSRTFKRGDLIPAMQKLGLGFGGDANAYTSLLETVYMLDLPNLEEKTVDFAFTIMRDFADGALLEDDAIDHERGIVISELKSRDSAAYRASIAVLEQLTHGTRTAQYMPIGSESVIRDAPYEIVRRYYREHYVPSRMTLIVTGDFDPQDALLWVKKHFETLEPREARPAPPIGQLSTDGAREKLVPNPEAADCSILITNSRPFEQKEDTVQQRLADFPLAIATEMLNRRLSRLSKREDCPFIAARLEKESLFRAAETYGVSLSATPANWQRALECVVQCIRQACTYGFTEQEMTEATAGLIANLEQACNTWETVPAPLMATRLVKALKEKKVITDPAQDLAVAQLGTQQLLQNAERGSEICREALCEAFDARQALLTLAGTLPEGVTEADLRAAYEKALQTELPQPEAEQKRSFAYETIGMPGVIMQQKTLDDLGITQLTLSNGVKVNLKPIAFRKGSISVNAAVDGGLMSLPALPGMPTMLNAVMQRGGLQEHSIDELESIFASKQVSLDFQADQTRFVFSGSTNERDLELQCKLLAAAIMHPGFRSEGELLLKRRLENEYKELETTPEGVLAMKGRRELFGENPRFVIPTQQQAESRNAQEVKSLLTPILRENALEVSIVGDFKIEEAPPILERTFGAMPQRKAEFSRPSDMQRQVEFRPWGQKSFLRYPTELDKTIVVQVYPAGNGRDIRRNRRLQVLSSIVRSKLFAGLRATMGESYSPRVLVVTNSEYDNAAYLMTMSWGVKRNREKVSNAMASICIGIAQGQISQEDFDCAIRPIISQVQKMLISPEFWEENLLRLQSEPERLDLIRDLEEDVKSITYEEILALGKEIFSKDDLTRFIYVVPEDDHEEEAPQQEQPAAATAAKPDLSSLNVPAEGEYAVLATQATAEQSEWKEVIDALLQKYPGSSLCVLPTLTEDACAAALREKGARYAAYVLRPEEISRPLINDLHRAARKIDDDPYGDCIWGIVTGYSPGDALRIAKASEPLVIRRALGTTELPSARFEHSYCIADQDGFPVLEQHDYTEPTRTLFTMDTLEGQDVIENGIQGKFAYQLATQKPQLIATSSHATPFNLEMPFSKGLIFPSNNRFYQVSAKQLLAFSSACQPAMDGKPGALQSLAEAMQFPIIEPDKTPRVWIAAGNCLIGDARQTNQSMVITALSAYQCHQFVGYTVPSWYGAAGWGTLELFLNHTDSTTLAEAFFLNNQFLLEKTIKLDPKLMQVEFNEEKMGPALQQEALKAGVSVSSADARDAVGLVHDRDTLAFYGDPGWAAVIDHSHQHAPLAVSWQSDTECTLHANADYSGRAAIWFPKASIGRNASSCDLKDAVFTNDFILIPDISLKAGESVRIRLLRADSAAQ